MSGSQVAVLGTGGHAASVADAATSCGFSITSFFEVDNSDSSYESLLLELSQLSLNETELVLGLGTNHQRETLHVAILRALPQARFPAIIHSTAWASPSATIAEGAALLAHSVAGPDSTVGAGSVLNTGASLDHHGYLGAFASLGPGARTGGNVTIGPRTMIGLQAGILQGRTVGEDSVVGAQSLVLEDIPSLSVAVGSPSRVIRSREREEQYY